MTSLIVCWKIFLTYLFNLQKCIARIPGFQRVVDFTLNIPGPNFKYSFSRFGARIWNSIPQRIRVPPKHKFKASLHQLLLESEDRYVDTPTLINKLSKLTSNAK